jgi:hypothetical protein
VLNTNFFIQREILQCSSALLFFCENSSSLLGQSPQPDNIMAIFSHVTGPTYVSCYLLGSVCSLFSACDTGNVMIWRLRNLFHFLKKNWSKKRIQLLPELSLSLFTWNLCRSYLTPLIYIYIYIYIYMESWYVIDPQQYSV